MTEMDTRIDREMDTRIDRQMDTRIDREMDTRIDREMDTRIDRQMDTRIDRQMDTRIGTLMERDGRTDKRRAIAIWCCSTTVRTADRLVVVTAAENGHNEGHHLGSAHTVVNVKSQVTLDKAVQWRRALGSRVTKMGLPQSSQLSEHNTPCRRHLDQLQRKHSL